MYHRAYKLFNRQFIVDLKQSAASFPSFYPKLTNVTRKCFILPQLFQVEETKPKFNLNAGDFERKL
jgi:hypothetical protein